MTILAITALIVLIVSGVMVLRLKGDPMENKAIKKVLADSEGPTATVSPVSSPGSNSKSMPPKT